MGEQRNKQSLLHTLQVFILIGSCKECQRKYHLCRSPHLLSYVLHCCVFSHTFPHGKEILVKA